MKVYTVQQYYDAIEEFAPFSLAEDWDNSGLLVGSGHQPVELALVALDATAAVIEEAEQLGANLIVTHHPVIFHKLGSVPAESPVYQAIKAGVAVISVHTNLDMVGGGVNDALAGRLELREPALLDEVRSEPWRKVVVYAPRQSAEAIYDAMVMAGAGRQGNYAGTAFLTQGEGRFMPLEGANPTLGDIGSLERAEEVRIEVLTAPDQLPKVLLALRASHPYEDPAFDIFETHAHHTKHGFGRIGSLAASLAPDAFAAYVREKLNAGGLRYVAGRENIRQVAVCGGSGGSYLSLAAAAGAQALVTADAKHDQLLEAARLGITLVDAGHYATEAVVLPALLERLQKALPGASLAIAEACADPAGYLAAQR